MEDIGTRLLKPNYNTHNCFLCKDNGIEIFKIQTSGGEFLDFSNCEFGVQKDFTENPFVGSDQDMLLKVKNLTAKAKNLNKILLINDPPVKQKLKFRVFGDNLKDFSIEVFKRNTDSYTIYNYVAEYSSCWTCSLEPWDNGSYEKAFYMLKFLITTTEDRVIEIPMIVTVLSSVRQLNEKFFKNLKNNQTKRRVGFFTNSKRASLEQSNRNSVTFSSFSNLLHWNEDTNRLSIPNIFRISIVSKQNSDTNDWKFEWSGCEASEKVPLKLTYKNSDYKVYSIVFEITDPQDDIFVNICNGDGIERKIGPFTTVDPIDYSKRSFGQEIVIDEHQSSEHNSLKRKSDTVGLKKNTVQRKRLITRELLEPISSFSELPASALPSSSEISTTSTLPPVASELNQYPPYIMYDVSTINNFISIYQPSSKMKLRERIWIYLMLKSSYKIARSLLDSTKHPAHNIFENNVQSMAYYLVWLGSPHREIALFIQEMLVNTSELSTWLERLGVWLAPLGMKFMVSLFEETLKSDTLFDLESNSFKQRVYKRMHDVYIKLIGEKYGRTIQEMNLVTSLHEIQIEISGSNDCDFNASEGRLDEVFNDIFKRNEH